MKKILIISFLLAVFTSCSNDVDLPEPPEVIVNEFFYGIEGTEHVQVESGFYRDSQLLGDGVVKTDVVITGEGFTVSTTDQLEGTGFLIDIDLNGNQNEPLQTGRYSISTDVEIGTAQVIFLESFDSTLPLNRGVTLESGTVIVQPYRNGYLVEIDAIDVLGNEFYGNYLGVPQLIL